jgi:hypothetical protein
MAILQELLQAQADRLLSLAQDVRAKGKTDLADLMSSRAKLLVAEVERGTDAPRIAPTPLRRHFDHQPSDGQT